MSSPTPGEEWISLHEAAQILNMKPSEMAEKFVFVENCHIRLNERHGKLYLNRADVLAMRVQE